MTTDLQIHEMPGETDVDPDVWVWQCPRCEMCGFRTSPMVALDEGRAHMDATICRPRLRVV